MIGEYTMNRILILFLVGLWELTSVADDIQLFDEPVQIEYGQSIAAPMKSFVSFNDADRDGGKELVASGGIWKQTGTENGCPVYSRAGKAVAFAAPFINLDGDEYSDTVVVKDGKYQWYEDASATGARDFVLRKNLEFVYGGDLVVPKGLQTLDYTLGDLDSDGLDDIVIVIEEYFSENGNPESDETAGYVPQKFAGAGRGWKDGQWVFNEVISSVLWHRNIGTKTNPLFSMGSPVKVGDFSMPLSFTSRGCSFRIFDFNRDGKNDFLVQSADMSYIYLNSGYDENGFVKFDNGRKVKYGDDHSIGHRKNADLFVDAKGLVHIFFSGGSVVYEAVQKDKDDPFDFTDIHYVLFKDPRLHLDIFAVVDVVDWDGDGRLDMIVGQEKGNIWFLKNVSPTGMPDKWAAPVELMADGKAIMLDKHFNLQGPLEWLIGYSNPTAADWDMDGDLDLIAGCHGEVMYLFENTGSRTEPVLGARGALKDKSGQEIKCAWRSRPGVADMTGDGLSDLVFAGQDGNILICKRVKNDLGQLALEPQQYLYDTDGYTLEASNLGRESGRLKISIVDWDYDGKLDIITNCFKSSRREFVYFFKNTGTNDGLPVFEFRPHQIGVANHCVTGKHTHYRMLEPADFNNDGKWEVVAGLDDGKIFYFDKPRLMSYKEKIAECKVPAAQAEPLLKAGEVYGSWRQAAFRGEVRPLKAGEKVFRNRNYVFNALPKELTGFNYCQVDIQDSFCICDRQGVVYLLVPDPDGPYRDCYYEYIVSKGFTAAGVKPFILFGDDTRNKVRVIKKNMKPGDNVALGSWAVPISKQP